MDAQLEKVAEWLGRAERCLVFTGGGRQHRERHSRLCSPGGVWSRTKPILFDEYRRDALAQLEYWRQRTETHLQFADSAAQHGPPGLRAGGPTAAFAASSRRISTACTRLPGAVTCSSCMAPCAKSAASIAACSSMRRRWSRGSSKRRLCPVASGAGTDQACDHLVRPGAADRRVATGDLLVCARLTCFWRSARRSSSRRRPTCRSWRKGPWRLVIINREPTPLDSLADLVLNRAIGVRLDSVDSPALLVLLVPSEAS